MNQAAKATNKQPLGTGEWITVTTPGGIQITCYAGPNGYHVTALDCYTRRLREPETHASERTARDLARKWTIELLGNHMEFDVSTNRNGNTTRYHVNLGA